MRTAKVLIISILSIIFLFVSVEKFTKTPPLPAAQEAKVVRATLSSYVAYLFYKQSFGYTLVGAKPMSFTTDLLPMPLAFHVSSFLYTFHNSENFLVRIWKKRNSIVTIVFINKKLFRKVYNEHKALFQETLGTASADDLLHRIATSEKSFFNIIHNNQTILGTLLGYGKGNASLFARWCEIFPNEYSIFYEPNIYFPKRHHTLSIELPKALIPSPPFKTLEEERAWFSKYFNKGAYDFTTFCLADVVFPVGFRVTDSEETEQLVKRYAKAKKVLTKLFTERDCLEVVEEQLHAAHPLMFDEMT